ncbi:MAG: hypothetical protein MCS20_02385, partial [Candidatus Phytoplasma mali]|nr:hypothetical protein [Candidatus Phytoplasma australiense]MCG7202230.1 hypothetical protein [Candidatus Phytoplasma mali]MCZ8633132.1 hypothetical protein [Spiroplasma sp. Tabriz.8]
VLVESFELCKKKITFYTFIFYFSPYNLVYCLKEKYIYIYIYIYIYFVVLKPLIKIDYVSK